MKSVRVNGIRLVCILLVAGLVLKTGCGNPFLGLEDYQRDLLGLGLLAAVLLNNQADTAPTTDGGEEAGQPIPGPAGPAGADGSAGPQGPAGADGQDGATGPAGQDGATGRDGADGQDGATGPAGATGSAGATGPAGQDGATGPAFFDIFIDDFFAASDPNSFPVFGDLPVNAISIEEPGIGAHPISGTVGPVAFRVAIPQQYDAGNDVTMRLFLHRTGDWNSESCQVITVDAARLRSGFGVEQYGSRRWIRTDPFPGPVSEQGWFLVVDLPINNVSPLDGLGYPGLSVSDFVAFEFATYTVVDNVEFPRDMHDGGLYHLLGVEFFESDPGTAALVGATVFSAEPDPPCGGDRDCNGNGTADEIDIAEGESEDCNENGIPDECDIEDGTSEDCQQNGIPDECDVADGAQGVVSGGPAGLLFPLDGTFDPVDFCADGESGSDPAECTGIPPDQHNDDDSATVLLPFSFDLYGTPFDTTFVNNNGNLSFGAFFSTFTAEGFPIDDFPMVAPFWGDVDTGNPSNPIGDVWMKFFDGDNNGSDETLVVTWNNVGYYDERDEQRNTFQVAISDGTNPVMGVGNNVCFSYQQMEWTTGEASDGIDGFGGVPATVGANSGDGQAFFQIGRFDHPGDDYDGPGGSTDGVEYLVGQQICFTASTTTSNINPIASNFPPGHSVTVAGSSGVLDLELQFLSPEVGQSTTVTYAVVTVEGSGSGGLIIEDTPGNVASARLFWQPECAQVGTYDVVFVATDDFDPPGVTEVTLRIIVACQTLDCNENSVPDECDIASGTSEDCNADGIPDECDIDEGTSQDANGNGIPNECED